MKKFTHKEVVYLVILTSEYHTKPLGYFVEKLHKNNCNKMVIIDFFPSAEDMHKMLDSKPDKEMEVEVNRIIPTTRPSLN